MVRHRKKELDARDIQALFERTPVYLYDRYRTLELPIGLTWAAAVEEENSTSGPIQHALTVANARALLRVIRALPEETTTDVWDFEEGWIVYRLLGTDGTPTQLAKEIAPLLLGLEDYAIIDEDVLSEVEHEGFGDLWEREVLGGIKEGSLEVWLRRGRVQVEIDEEDLFEGWEDELFEAYRNLESETNYDDYGYAVPDLEVAAKALVEIGVIDEDQIEALG